MKTIFKSMLLTALVMGMATAAMAQNTGVPTSVTASARVLKQISITGANTNVNFGGVFAGVIPYLDPKGAATASVGFTATVGSIVVNATAGEPIRVEFPDKIDLELTGTPATKIAYIPEISVLLAASGTTLDVNTRASSVLLGTNNTIPTGETTATGGLGQGPFGVIATQLNEEALLVIGGRLGDVTSTAGGAGGTGNMVAIPSGQATGNYTGTLNFNILYAL